MGKAYDREIFGLMFSGESSENPQEKALKAKLFRSLIDSDLTNTQKCYIIAYYKNNMKICEIAQLFNIAPSTVSRTINRAKKRLFRAMTGRELYYRYSKTRGLSDAENAD